MQLKRFFSTAAVKNTYSYIDTQKKYEIIRTIVYFGVSLSLFIAGYMTTKSQLNVLTVVAVLGCLPASKSLVSAIMFCRFKSCSDRVYQRVNGFDHTLSYLYELVFTTEKATFVAAHAAYKSGSLVLYTEKPATDISALEKHVEEYLKRASISGVTVKAYKDLEKYCARLSALEVLEREEGKRGAEVLQLLREITL